MTILLKIIQSIEKLLVNNKKNIKKNMQSLMVKHILS